MDEAAERRRHARGDLAAGLILFAVAAVGTIDLLGNTAIHEGEFGRDPGPGLLPTILVALLAAGSLALVVMGAVRLRATRDGAPFVATPWRVFAVPTAMAATLALYVTAMTPLGFIEATLGFTVLWTIVLGWQDDGRPTLRRLAVYAAQAAGIAAAIWLVFAELIKVPLP